MKNKLERQKKRVDRAYVVRVQTNERDDISAVSNQYTIKVNPSQSPWGDLPGS
jgi:hypothetical protein